YKIKDTSQAGNLPKRIGNMTLGVKIGENYVDYSEGPLKETGNALDLALSSNGFFTIEYTNKAGETSTKYTRDGNFTMTSQGYLVTQDGDFVLGERGRRIRLDTTQDIRIDRMGNIYQDDEQVASLQITDFEDYDYLEKYGETYFRPLEGARLRNGGGTATVNSGYLEMANVQAVSEMVNLIAITRAYEANQKIIQTYDDSLQIAVTQLGRLS
ncbi:MAG: flagellar hook-basal body protein, partial [Acetatifactor sp.]|nr:flagellar hook-basal body protein [Acetatifactor sp.]